MKEAIRQYASRLGFDGCRFAAALPPATAPRFHEWIDAQMHGTMAYLEKDFSRRTDPREVLPGVQTLISLAAAYPTGPKHPPQSEAETLTGRIAHYACSRDYHEVLAKPLRSLAAFVENFGDGNTRTRTYVDTGPVLERAFGQESGLGFVGKHTNLISRHLGNWFFLAEILTTLKLDPDPPEPNRCGSCTRCLQSCPTQAITAPFTLDARRCISYLTIELKGPIPRNLRPLIGDRIFGCDDCLEVCPWNRFAQVGNILRDDLRPELRRPDLLELLRLDNNAFRNTFRGTPLWRGKRVRLLRNTCVALGNVGGASALPSLDRASHDPEPLIAEHALWAAETVRTRIQAPRSQTRPKGHADAPPGIPSTPNTKPIRGQVHGPA